MSEERKPVICPWCGEKMQQYNTPWKNRYQCECGAESPTAETPEYAYIVATSRPQNRPLTRDEARALDPHTPIYAQFRDGDVITGPYAIGDALPRGEWPEYGKTVRWWTKYPTEAERGTKWEGDE